MFDVIFRGGRVFDPGTGLDCVMDVATRGHRIAAMGHLGEVKSRVEVNASGCLVLPGLIDFHVHAFWGGNEASCLPDVSCLPHGVTTCVDAGSAGTSNFHIFHTLAQYGITRVRAQINVSPTGLATRLFSEDVAPQHIDRDRLAFCVERYKDFLIGLKIRAGAETLGTLGLEPVKTAAALARNFGLPLVVHTTGIPCPPGDLLDCLSAGDIYTHAFQGKANPIADETTGKLDPAVLKARERGVLFDATRGMKNGAFSVMRNAFAEGFFPDIIGSDINVRSLGEDPGFSLPYSLSCFLNLGMPLAEIIRACTATPAKLLGMEGEIGTLKENALADITMFALREVPCSFFDARRERLRGDRMLVPLLTMKDGKIFHRTLDSLDPDRGPTISK